MIYNKHLYLRRIKEVATKLDYLLEDVVFVGGSVVALYADDPAADEVRPTDDVDIVTGIYTTVAYSAFEGKIRKLGFINVQDSKFLGRYKINEVIVDVMPVSEQILGFSNRWYEKGIAESLVYKVDEEISIRLMPFNYFVASKIEAHLSRNRHDLRTSKDFEDIVYLFDNRIHPLADLQESNGDLKSFLLKEINRFLEDANFHEGVSSHLNSWQATARLRRIKEIWSVFVME